jgi:hypothetical protein
MEYSTVVIWLSGFVMYYVAGWLLALKFLWRRYYKTVPGELYPPGREVVAVLLVTSGLVLNFIWPVALPLACNLAKHDESKAPPRSLVR